MEEVKVARNYQVTIPVSIRERLRIKEGDVLVVYIEDDRIVFRKLSDTRKRHTFSRRLTLKDIEVALKGVFKAIINAVAELVRHQSRGIHPA